MPRAADAAAPAAVLADLDPAQAAAVTTPSRLVAVIAGAGSGKTRVLTRRIAYRLATGTADARHTVALTFTREAAGELRRRLRRSGVREHVEAGTFHAIALGLLRQRWIDLDQRPPTVVGDRDRVLAEVASGVPTAVLASEVEWAAARGLAPDGYVAAARAAGRRAAISPEQIAERLAAYEQLKRRRGVVDLDDLLAMAARQLAEDPSWAEIVRWRYRHVLVDEAQDLNPLQHRLLELVVGGRDDLYLVGDPAQAIYGFNGADPTLLTDVAARLHGVEVIHLPTNHRSTPQVVAAGIHVLRDSGLGQDAVSSRGDGAAVRVVAADDEEHEAALVTAFVRAADPALLRGGHVAVLARTNAQLTRLAGALTASGLGVRRRQLAAGSPLALAVRTATAQPSASRLRGWAHDVLDAEADGPPDDTEAAERRVAVAVLEFLRDQPFGDGAALRSWIATSDPFTVEGAGGGVELLTFHGAKGREWHTVVVSGVETGSVPHRSATTIAAKAEEARLLHVAITRATDRLVITWAGRRGGYRRRPSPLIEGLDLSPAPLVPPPAELRTGGRVVGNLERLVAWRDEAARVAGVLPPEVCSDADLAAIADGRPTTPAELATLTSMGPLTAARLFPSIDAALT